MNQPTPPRARTEIKALVDEMKHLAANAPQPAQGFASGILTGLAAAVQILDGDTAEGVLEQTVQRLSAAIGNAYLEGKLPHPVASPAAVMTAVSTPVTPGMASGITASCANASAADVQRVISLYERWLKAGPPPLGASMARWWDARLLELCTAINGPGPKNPT